MSFLKKSVRARVMEVVNKRIEEAESRFSSQCEEINNQTTEAMSALLESSKKRKEEALEGCVDFVLN